MTETKAFSEWIHTGSEPARLLCPCCGSDDIQFCNDVIEWRSAEIRSDGTLWITYNPGNYSEGSGDRLECRGCWETVPMESDVIEVEYD